VLDRVRFGIEQRNEMLRRVARDVDPLPAPARQHTRCARVDDDFGAAQHDRFINLHRHHHAARDATLDVGAQQAERRRKEIERDDAGRPAQHCAAAFVDLIDSGQTVHGVVIVRPDYGGERLRSAFVAAIEVGLDATQQLLRGHGADQLPLGALDDDRAFVAQGFDGLVRVRDRAADALRNAVSGRRRLAKKEEISRRLQLRESKRHE